jgi:hypothetical protein
MEPIDSPADRKFEATAGTRALGDLNCDRVV